MPELESDPLVATLPSHDAVDTAVAEKDEDTALPEEVAQSHEALIEANTTGDAATVESARIAFFTSIKTAFVSIHDAPDEVYDECDSALRKAKEIIGS